MPVIRSRDIRTTIGELGYEKGVVHLLEQMAEQASEQRTYTRELVGMVDRCITELDKLNRLDDGLRQKIEQLERDRRDTSGEDNQ